MIITTIDVLKKLKEVSSRHLRDKPEIGIDSLSLGLNIAPNVLVPLLLQLRKEDYIILYRANAINNRSNGRIDDYVSVSLL